MYHSFRHVFVTTLLLFTVLPVFSAQTKVYSMGSRGYVLIECEDMEHSGNWVKKTGQSGYTGSGYLTWNGDCWSCECKNKPSDDDHNDITGACQPPVNDRLYFTVQITEAGRYTLDVRNWHKNTDGSNDAWFVSHDESVRVIANTSGDRIIYRIVDGVASEWSWCTSDILRFQSYDLQPGYYTFYFGPRSTGFNADRIGIKKVIGIKNVTYTDESGATKTRKAGVYAAAATNPNTSATPSIMADTSQSVAAHIPRQSRTLDRALYSVANGRIVLENIAATTVLATTLSGARLPVNIDAKGRTVIECVNNGVTLLTVTDQLNQVHTLTVNGVQLR